MTSRDVPPPELPERGHGLQEGVQPEPPAKRRDELQRKRAFGWLPNSVALDPRVGPETLILLAFRSTCVDYSLDRKGYNMLIAGGGLGQRVVSIANAEAVGLGLLERHQPGGRPGSSFRCAVEKLTLPEPGERGRCRMIVRRSWFNGTLTLRELAALLYLRAAGRVLRRELASRFGWGRRTALAVLRSLATKNLVVGHETRAADGAFGPTFYRVVDRVRVDLGTAAMAIAAAPDHPPKLQENCMAQRRTAERRTAETCMTSLLLRRESHPNRFSLRSNLLFPPRLREAKG